MFQKFILLLYNFHFCHFIRFLPFYFIPSNINTSEIVYTFSEELKANGVHGNLASNGKWEYSSGIAYYLNSRYYGIPKGSTSEEIEKELLDNKIDYYMVWGDSDGLSSSKYTEIIQIKNPN